MTSWGGVSCFAAAAVFDLDLAVEDLAEFNYVYDGLRNLRIRFDP